MKDKQYRLAKLKYQLQERKRNGTRYVMWKLNREQVEYIVESLGYQVTPYLYRIRTRRLKNYKATQSSLLKEIHHANKAGKKTIMKKLSAQQIKVLDQYEIKYWPEKYRIKLS